MICKPPEAFLMNDQPFSCPHCGARTETLANFNHKAKWSVEKCLDDQWGFICLQEEDKEFIIL